MKFTVCIGNGLHADSTTSAMNKEIVEKAAKLLEEDRNQKIILCGGYRNENGVTEARSMENYLLTLHPYAKYIRENKSYRTHNNAIEALRIVRDSFAGKGTEVIVIDHPQHLPRTVLSFRSVNHIYYDDKYEIIGVPAEEVYDSNVPGQEYWASRESFAKHEKNSMLLYKFLLWRPWARIGLWLLKTVWPSGKQ